MITSLSLALVLDMQFVRRSIISIRHGHVSERSFRQRGGKRQQIHRDYLSIEMSDDEDPMRLHASAIIATSQLDLRGTGTTEFVQ